MKKSMVLTALFLLTASQFFCGCGAKLESTETLKKTRQGYEKLIAQYGIPLYTNSEFVELGKTGSGPGVIYKTSDSADQVIDFYYNQMKELKLLFVNKSPALFVKINGKDTKVTIIQGVGPNRKNNDPLQIVVSMPGQEGLDYQMIAYAVGYNY